MKNKKVTELQCPICPFTHKYILVGHIRDEHGMSLEDFAKKYKDVPVRRDALPLPKPKFIGAHRTGNDFSTERKLSLLQVDLAKLQVTVKARNATIRHLRKELRDAKSQITDMALAREYSDD